MDALIELGGGDMRRTLNLLQSTHMSAGEITEETGEEGGVATGLPVPGVGIQERQGD